TLPSRPLPRSVLPSHPPRASPRYRRAHDSEYRWPPMVRASTLGGVALLLLLAPWAQAARTLDSLGTLERQAVDDALAERGLTIDPAPEGKTVGTIHVFNHEVFSRRDGYFQLLNVFHVT